MADRHQEPVGRLFPAGGPVPVELVIGRDADIQEVTRRVHEGIHTLLMGPRRIGKTTVCDAACSQLEQDGMLIVGIEVPERSDSTDLLQQMVDRCNRISLTAAGWKLLRAIRPTVEKFLAGENIPLDLNELAAEPGSLPTRSILALPLTLAEQTGLTTVFFADELQRAVEYSDGEQVLTDLVDIYSGQTDVVVVVDGSQQRTLDGMLGGSGQMGKLCDRLPLEPTIPARTWRDAMPARFEQAGLELDPEALEKIISFGEGHPYRTMIAARYAALNARKLGSESVGVFEVEMALDEAERHLREDG
jgi:AAA ATPase domain